MSVEAAAFRFESGPRAFSFHQLRQRAHASSSMAQAQPDDTGQPAPPERAELAEPDLEARRPGRRHAIGDPLGLRKLDVAEKSERQVQVGGGRPPEIGRQGAAPGEERIQGLAMRLGHGQPEERADYARLAQ